MAYDSPLRPSISPIGTPTYNNLVDRPRATITSEPSDVPSTQQTPQHDDGLDSATPLRADQDNMTSDFDNFQQSRPDSPNADATISGPHYRAYMILRGHKRAISAVKFSPDGKLVASCCKSDDDLVYTMLIINSWRCYYSTMGRRYRQTSA